MAIKLNIPAIKQIDVVKYVGDTFEVYEKRLEAYNKRNLDIYKEYSTFTEDKRADWKTTFKVNKAHEVVNKILPRLMSRTPKWLVSSKPDMLLDAAEKETPEEKMARYEQLQEYNQAIKDYLSTVFDKYNLLEPARLWAKNMIIYGNSFAKIKFKMDIGRSQEATDEEEVYIDENGQEVVEKKTSKVKEYVYNQYPTIDNKSWSEIYYDPRYKVFNDAPAVIEVVYGVRLSELKGK